ncbi:MAG: tRNA (N(6)-L-threonylcarbamoyladenosine(37)-C(2))-methylthiotransferase MtaB [Cellulosilyticaceae bacterium]
MKLKKAAFYTLGCKVNQYDTEAVVEAFKAADYEIVSFNEYADVYLVNTCTVTHLSDRKCRQALRKTKKVNPNSILIAMGCYAQSAKEKIKEEVEEVDIIVGTNHRSQIVKLVEEYNETQVFNNTVANIMDVEEFEELKISAMDEHTRVYLKIQEGCNNYCTYCIIPYVRGKIRSRKEENVMDEAKRLAEAGFKEIILTGIHVASYGKDLEDVSLTSLIPKIHGISDIERLRMSSIEPIVVTDKFVEMIEKLPKLCRHFHLSLQSGCDTVLKRMNRKYQVAEYEESVRRLREVWPDVAITTDIIVGFPGETEEEFEQTLEFVKHIQFAQVHIFPYSTREGTPAAKMKDQVAPAVKELRVKRLKKAVDESSKAFLQTHLDKEVEVLFEQQGDGKAYGHTSNYLKVEVSTDEDIANSIQLVKVDNICGELLEGHIVG